MAARSEPRVLSPVVKFTPGTSPTARGCSLSQPPDHERVDAHPHNGRHLNVNIQGLDRLSRGELRSLWTQELRDRPPATLGRDILALGIAYARQERLCVPKTSSALMRAQNRLK